MTYVTITKYDAATGELDGVFNMSPDNLLLQDFDYVSGAYNQDEYYVDSGSLVPFPAKPSPYHSWDWANKEYIPDVGGCRDYLLGVTSRNYLTVCGGRNPETGGGISVNCNGYIMDAGKDAAQSLDAGVRLAEELGYTTMTIRDFNNANHTVSIDTAKEIRKIQSADAHSHWVKKAQIVDAINAATTIEELEAIDTNIV